MNWVDLAIVASLGWFTFAAFQAGLIREVVTIAGAVAAVALAGIFYTELAKDVMVAIDDEQTSRLVAFAMIFGATVLASQLIAFFLKQVASLFFLGGMDKIGGAALGFLKGLVFVEIALIIALTFPTLGVTDAVRGSELAPLFLDVLPFLKGLLPPEFRDAIDSF
jgi:membrane protein required for colicin V production